MASEKQIAANRANAKRSTGPKTAVGKTVSSRNAFGHGLSCPLPPGLPTSPKVHAIARALTSEGACDEHSASAVEFACRGQPRSLVGAQWWPNICSSGFRIARQ
jgi:hypothetical protein